MSSFNNPLHPLAYRSRSKLDPNQADSEGFGKGLADYAQTGLQGALRALDTPGSIVRGGLGKLVGARPAEGERTSGRDLVNAIGITSKHDHSWLAGGLGLAAEVALDPLTYLTLGTHSALTGAGKAIAKTGGTRGLSRQAMIQGFHGIESSHLADQIRLGKTQAQAESALAHARNQGKRIATPAQEQAVLDATGQSLQPNQPLGALAGIGIPFREPSILLGTGSKAQAIARKMDLLGDKLKFGNPLGRAFNAAFDPAVNEATGGASQRAFAAYGRPALETAKNAGRDDTYRAMAGVDSAIKSGLPEDQVLRAARQHAEGVAARGASPQVVAAAQPIGTLARSAGDARMAEAVRLGLPLADLGDQFVSHVPRQGVDLASARQVAAGKAPVRIGVQSGPGGNLPLTSSANRHREEAYRNVPGGTEMLNALAMKHAGDPLGLGRYGIRRDVLRSLAGELTASGTPLTRALVKQLGDKSTVLAMKFKGLSLDYSAHGIPLYSPNIVQDLGGAGEAHARTVASAKAIFGFIGDNARPTLSLPLDSVPVSQVLKKLGLKTRPFDATTGKPIEGALVRAHEALARQGAGPVDALLAGKMGKLRRSVDRYSLPRSLADEILASHAKWTTPETVKGPLGLFDSTTSLFKSLAYPLWPASHFRNAVGAGLNNLLSGTGVRDHLLQYKLMRGTATADDIRKAIPSLPAGLTDDAAREFARREQYATGGVFDGNTGSLDLDNVAAKLASQVPGRTTPIVPGSDRTAGGSFAADTAGLLAGGAKDQAKVIAEKIRHPLAAPSPIEVAGAFGGVKDFPALETGRAVGSNIEDLFRGAHWLGQRRAGFDAATAGKATKDLHFDYGDLTNWDRNVMRRAFPFYTFSKKNIPLQIGRATSTPGSTVAQMRVMAGAQGDSSAPLPGSLSGGVTIPLGKSNDGRHQYLSGFGTPLEEALGRIPFKAGAPDLRGSAMSWASGLNPLLKAPAESLADLDFFSGRKLSDTKPSATASALGRAFGDDNPQALSHVLANTPAARFLSTADRLVDDRKGTATKALALATGLRLSSFDLEKARLAEEAQARQEIMAGMKHLRPFTNYSVRPGEEANLAPAEVEMLQAVKEARQAARENAPAKPQRIGIQFRRSGD